MPPSCLLAVIIVPFGLQVKTSLILIPFLYRNFDSFVAKIFIIGSDFLQSIRNSHRDLAAFIGGRVENDLAAKSFCPALDVF